MRKFLFVKCVIQKQAHFVSSFSSISFLLHFISVHLKQIGNFFKNWSSTITQFEKHCLKHSCIHVVLLPNNHQSFFTTCLINKLKIFISSCSTSDFHHFFKISYVTFSTSCTFCFNSQNELTIPERSTEALFYGVPNT